MDSSNSKKYSEAFNITTIALVSASFMAGIYVGRKLSNTAKRVSSLISVGPSKLALVVRNDLKMSSGKLRLMQIFMLWHNGLRKLFKHWYTMNLVAISS